MQAVTRFIQLTAKDSKELRDEIKKAVPNAKVKLHRNGSMHVYHKTLMGKFTPAEKSALRDVFVFLGLVNACGEAFTSKHYDRMIYDGMALRRAI